MNGSVKDWEGGSYGQFEGTDLACAWRYWGKLWKTLAINLAELKL